MPLSVIDHLTSRLLPSATKPVLSQLGFKLELRQQGDLALGLWRKPLGPKTSSPRRLVIVPGFGDTPLSWALPLIGLLPVLKKHYDEWLLLDIPGFHGHLGPRPAFDTMDGLLSATRAAIGSLSPKTLMGHSLGGWISTDYALASGTASMRAPEKLILISPSGHPGTPEEQAQWEQLFNEVIARGFEPLRRHVFAREPFWFGFVANGFGKFVERADVLSFLQSVRPEHSFKGRLSKLPQLGVRVSLLWGDLDRLTPTSWLESWKAELVDREPGLCEFVTLKDVGHSPQLESPALTVGVLSYALRGLPIPPPEKVRLAPLLTLDWKRTRWSVDDGMPAQPLSTPLA